MMYSKACLHCWDLVEIPLCPLCLATEILKHILISFPRVLGGGRYTWRHDHAPRALTDTICTGIPQSKYQPLVLYNIILIRSGEKPQAELKVPSGLLAPVHDQQLKADLRRKTSLGLDLTHRALCAADTHSLLGRADGRGL